MNNKWQIRYSDFIEEFRIDHMIMMDDGKYIYCGPSLIETNEFCEGCGKEIPTNVKLIFKIKKWNGK